MRPISEGVDSSASVFNGGHHLLVGIEAA